jgi:PAS domain S-box-containing protein
MKDDKNPSRSRQARQSQAEAALQAIRDEKVDAVVGRDRLIMLRLRETEEHLRLSEARYRSIVDSQLEMICRWTPERVLTFVNEAYCRFYRRPREELIGQKVAPSVYGPDAEKVNRYLDNLVSEKSPGDTEYRIVLGQDIHWTEWADQAIFDAQGKLLEIQSVGRDITDRKQFEDALRQANQELSEFTYALTHSLRAPMRAVASYTNFLYEDLANVLEGESKQYLEGLKKAITLSNRQFDELQLLYSIKNDPAENEDLVIGELLAEIQSALQLTSNHQLILARQWPVLRCERQSLRQILMNLINNGFKFNQADIKYVEVGWQPAGEHRIDIFVRDNGIGIDPQYHGHIFEIFRRLHTEREYEGTGIGLAIVRRAATQMGGSVRVESTPGRGSTFFVNLPHSPSVTGF